MSFSLSKIGEGSFKNCKSLKQIQIPSSITAIKDDVFRNCSSLEKISIPSTLISIGKDSFQNCKSLKKIILPTSLTSIGERSFMNCTSLEKINLPSSLISIGFLAFDGCTSLKQMSVPPSTKIEITLFSKINNSSRISDEFQPIIEEQPTIDIIIAMVGLYYTGKTCIVESYIKDQFIDQFHGTVSVNYQHKEIIIDYYSEVKVKVKIYDANTRFIDCLCWGIDIDFINGFMLVFDLSDRDSLYYVIDWYISFKENYDESKYAFVLVGNKSDLKQRIPYEEIEEIAREQELEYFEISAKNYLGIDELFNYFTSYIYHEKMSHDI